MYIDRTKCVLCGLCINACRNDAIYYEYGHFKIDDSKCAECGKCQQICKEDAIVDFEKELYYNI